MRWIDARFGNLADGDWAMPLLHRVAKILTHLEERRNDPDLKQSRLELDIFQTANSHGGPLGIIEISCRDDVGVLLPTGQFSVLAQSPGPVPWLEEIGDRDFILATVDRFVHLAKGVWAIELSVSSSRHGHVIASYPPPLYESVYRYSDGLPERRLRARLA